MSRENVRAVKDKTGKGRTVLFVIAINLLVFLGLLAAIEIGFRTVEKTHISHLKNAGQALRFFWTMYRPFVMFVVTPLKHYEFANLYARGAQSKKFDAEFKLNSDGFVIDHELDFSKPYPKGKNERFVLFTGGSAAWGVGATNNNTNVAGRMEYYLNRKQSTYKYRVLNFGNGGWMSFQEFVALAYWGRSYAADWVITMDGVNDGTLVCGEANGAGRPMHNDSVEAYVMAYLFGQTKPVFFRGWLEDTLLRHSSLYRGITGQSPLRIPSNLDYLLGSTPEGRQGVMRDVKWIEVERQRHFYIDTQRQIANLFPSAKVILSTQPMVNQFRGHFMNIYDHPRGSPERQKAIQELEQALQTVYNVMHDKPCGNALKGENFGYFFAIIALGTERVAQSMSTPQRPVIYENMGRFFEDDFESRKQYFVDPVHMSEKGMDVLGQKYAQIILSSDLAQAEMGNPALSASAH